MALQYSAPMPAFATAHRLAPCRSPGEDRLLVLPLPGGLVIAVADDAGGQSGGARAADLLIEEVMTSVSRSGYFEAQTWVDLLEGADGVIWRDRGAGETTAVVVAVSAAGLVGASVGDSEAWVVGPRGGLDDLTGGQQRARLGSGQTVPLAFARPALGGTLIVGSDGLFKYLAAGVIASLAGAPDLDTAAAQLAERTRLRSGDRQDDLALVLARSGG